MKPIHRFSLFGQRPVGPEKVTNGNFDQNITGWTNLSGAGSSASWEAGAMRVENDASATVAAWYQSFPSILGRRMRIRGRLLDSGQANLCYIGFYSGVTLTYTAFSAVGQFIDIVLPSELTNALGNTIYCRVDRKAGPAANFGVFDDISVREV